MSSFSEEKDQLHITVEELRQEKTQIKAELENMVETQQSQVCEQRVCPLASAFILQLS